jgi:hypothetical protein
VREKADAVTSLGRHDRSARETVLATERWPSLSPVALLLVLIVGYLLLQIKFVMERQRLRSIALSSSSPETCIRISRIWDVVEQKVGAWLRGQLTPPV